MQLKHLIIILLPATLLLACRKYVEVEPQGKITPSTIADYKLLLNNNAIFNLSFGTNDFPTDDIAFTNDLTAGISTNVLTRIYQWQEQFYQTNEDDPEWNLFYKQIYTANVVIEGLKALTSGTGTEKQQVTAAAKVHRAYAYLCLINLYAAPYKATDAATAPGVPLLTQPGYTQSLERASIEAVYNQVLDDLNTALTDLPDLPAVKTDPSKAAVYALLARTWLYMGNYTNALTNAESTLKLQNAVLDLNTYLSAAPAGFPFPGFYLPLSQNDPDVILMKAANNQDAPLCLSSELLNLLGTKDLRRFFYTFNGPDLGTYSGTYFAYFAPLEPRHVGPRVSEVMLIKAECLARNNSTSDAMQVINDLRRKRFKPADYTQLSASSPAEALQLVLAERRRELFARGFRLFDLKRYNLDPAMAKTITHPLPTQSLTLAPGSNRYVYPIAPKVIGINQEITQNPR